MAVEVQEEPGQASLPRGVAPWWSPASLFPALLAAVAVVAAAVIVVWSAVSVVEFHTVLPVGDQWTFITTDVAKYMAGDYGPGDLFALHNEHRILWARLVLWTDLLVFDGQQRFGLASVAAVQIAHFLLLARVAWRNGPAPVWQRVFLIALLAALMSWAIQFENFTRAFQVQFVLVFATASASFMLATSARRAWADQRATTARRYMVGALVVGVASALSMVNGLLVLPLVVVYLAAAGAPRRWTATTAALAAIVIGVYFIGYQTPGTHSSITAAVVEPAKTVRYAALYLGGFLGLHLYPLAFGVGLFGGIAAAVGPVALWRPRLLSNRLLAVCALNALFVLLAAVVSAAGRVNFEPFQMVVSRYQTPSMLLWWSVIAMAVVLVGRWLPSWAPVVLCTALFVTAALLVPPLQVRALHSYDLEHDARNLAEIGLQFGVVDEQFNRVAGKPEMMLPAAAVLREQRWSIFADPLPLGRGIEQFGTMAAQPCQGRVDRRRPIGTSPEHGVVERVEGWAAPAGGAVHEVLFTDQAGAVVGAAFTGRPRPDVAEALGSDDLADAGWGGYVAGVAKQPIRTFARTVAKGQSALCELE